MTSPASRPNPSTRTETARRVIIIDDSVVARVTLAQSLDAEPGFVVAESFDRAERALTWLSNNPCDLILLDLEMPGRSGLAALPDLISASGTAQIVVVSSIAAEGAAATLHALSLGATDAIAKPGSGPIGRQFGLTLVQRLKGLMDDSITPIERPAALAMREGATTPAGCLAIGASTGGIHALARLLAHLPQSFAAPILITQHLPHPFMPFFADQLATLAQRPCAVARDGQPLVAGSILVAPGDGHLCVAGERDNARIAIRHGTVASRCLPSVDPMFESVGQLFGAAAIGVVLSGMGRDGAEGAAVIARQGGTLLVQDVESATIWGMPGSVARAGLASLVGTPERIADYLTCRRTRQ